MVSVLAVDLGGSHATCGLLSSEGLLAYETIRTDGHNALATILPEIAAVLRQLLLNYGHGSRPLVDSCAGIAFSFCGLVDSDHARILSVNGKYVDGPEIDLVRWARTELGLAIRLENDARMALLGERYAGAGIGFDDIVMMTLGTGIGGAAMMGGRLLQGKHYQAGCLGGHFTVNRYGQVCSCGNIGCVEAEASSWSLPSICANQPGFRESKLATLSSITFKDVFDFAREGDDCACEVLSSCVKAWAAGAVSLIHAYDPELLILGGGVMNAAEQILPAFTDRVLQHAWTPWGKVEIRAATLGSNAALFGAVPLVEQTH